MSSKILYLENKNLTPAIPKFNLGEQFDMRTFTDPLEALQSLYKDRVDAIVSEGLDFFHVIKQNNLQQIPFFVLSGESNSAGKTEVLKNGVSDCFCPAMSPDEVYTRIKNRIAESKLSFQNITIDLYRFLAYFENEILDLTQIEFKLLLLVVKKQGSLVTRDEIKSFIWPNLIVLDKTINSHLTNLRAKIETTGVRIISVKNKGICGVVST